MALYLIVRLCRVCSDQTASGVHCITCCSQARARSQAASRKPAKSVEHSLRRMVLEGLVVKLYTMTISSLPGCTQTDLGLSATRLCFDMAPLKLLLGRQIAIQEIRESSSQTYCLNGNTRPRFDLVYLAAATMSNLQFDFLKQVATDDELRTKVLARAVSAYEIIFQISRESSLLGQTCMYLFRNEVFVRRHIAANQDRT